MKKPKKRAKRSQINNPNLVKKYNSRIRQEYLDYDYLDQLSEDELNWLNKFTEEYLGAKPVLDDDKNLDPEANIHKSPEFKKETYDANNRRNADLYGNLRNKTDKFFNTQLLNYDNVVQDVEFQLSRDLNPGGLENAYIDYLDKKHLEEMLEEYEQAMLMFNETTSLGQE